MQDDEISPAAPPLDWAARLLAFWFDAHGFDDWYGGGPDFDAAVEGLAGEWREALRVLRPGGRLCVADTTFSGSVPDAIRSAGPEAWCG